MGANNHTTVVPNDNSTEDLINYDADNNHDKYMMGLRLDLIRSGTLTTSLSER